jgi:hypothetical protein
MGEGSKDKFYGMNPKGMEKYLIEQLPHICAKHDSDPQWITDRAKAMCHDPWLKTNFDQIAPHPTSTPTSFDAMSFSRAILTVGVCVQKGHAIGGSMITILSCKCSRHHCRGVEDATWCSVCPLVNANGELLFIGFVLKGKLMVSDALKENLWAEGSVLEGVPKIMANSAAGYSSTKINLAQRKLGIAHLKKTRPELFPMVCWLDSFSGHTDGNFRKFCRPQGVTLMSFMSHSTAWACAFDKQVFGLTKRHTTRRFKT